MTITISDSLAQALDRKRQEAGLDSLDATAEALLAGAMYVDATDSDRLGYTDDELRALIAEGEASGPAASWDAAAVRGEVRSRFAARRPA
ncbi:MAG: hypothetical protein ACOYJ6_19245 [Caulobacterales bacterium]